MKCLLDMDGVLVDIIGGLARAHQLPADPYDDPAHLGKYALSEVMGMKPWKIWKPCGFSFWSELEPLPECHDIIALVEATFGRENVCLLSTPIASTTSVSGKFAWIYKHLPDYRFRFLLGAPKSFCAHSRSVLIDDCDGNVDTFTMAGGSAVLYPQRWNKLHADAHQRFEVLKRELAKAVDAMAPFGKAQFGQSSQALAS